MPLELQLSRSRFFYGRLEVGGRRIFLSLRVRVEGRPPATLWERGDDLFERSRLKAQAKLDRVAEKLRERATREELAQKVLEARTGSRLGSIPLAELADRWEALPRKRTPAKRYVAVCVAAIGRFLSYMGTSHPGVKEMATVQPEMAEKFMSSELQRGITAKTYNDVLVLLRSCFERLRGSAGLSSNPFEDIPTRTVDTISRVPFTSDELSEILTEAAKDEFIYPLVATGASTAMRLGDCARLRWESLDLANSFVRVKTSKTGVEVEIPILRPLQLALSTLKPARNGFVFPALAKQYELYPDKLTDRIREVFTGVGFGEQKVTGAESRGAFNVERKQGLRRASLRDFHTFRTTWVTLALNAGVPLELVTRVTGHRTAEIVLKNYHRPGRTDFRDALEKKLPKVLTGGSVKRSLALDTDTIVARLKAMAAANWEELRDELVCDLASKVE